MKAQGSIARSLLVVAGLVCIGIGAGVLLTAKLDWTEKSTAQSVAPPVNYRFAAVPGLPMVGESGQSPFVAVAERVAPTVVNITSNRKVSANDPMENFFRDSPFWEFFHRSQPERPRRQFNMPSTGSGIIISRDGYILTNNHVVAGADKVTVKVLGGREYKAEIVGRDPDTDVAVIKVDHQFDPKDVALIGNSDSIRVGDWAIAMGNPLGLDWTLTVGVISAKGRSGLNIEGGGPSYQDFIQTDASINFGNSGGPLCNIHGEVIGVNAAINPSGQGIGFAIPIDMAMKVVDQLREKGTVARGYLGMLPRELTAEMRSALDIPEDVSGVFVERVEKNTPAAKGGLKEGDVITQVSGKKVTDPQQFRRMIADNPPGSRVNLDVLRDGKRETLAFTLGDRSKQASLFGREEEEQPVSERWLGIKVEAISEQMARALELEETQGVLVSDVDPDGPAANKIQERDVIIEINRKPVNDLSDYRRITKELQDTKKAVLFRLIRNGQKTFEAVEP